LKAFQQHQECTQIPLKKWFNNNGFHTLNQRVSNQVDAPLLTEGFLKIPRAWHEAPWFGRSQCDKIKQTTLPQR